MSVNMIGAALLHQLEFVLVSYPPNFSLAYVYQNLILSLFTFYQKQTKVCFKDLNRMLNVVQQQIKEIEKLRSLRQNIDPSAQ